VVSTRARRVLTPEGGGANPPGGTSDPVAQPPAEATGREPVQWRFESAQGHQRSSARGATWQTRHAQTVQIGVRIPASRPFWRDARPLGGRFVVSEESTGSNPVRPARMGPSFNGRIRGLHPRDEGSIPSGSTTAPSANGKAVSVSTRRCGFESRWRHQRSVAEGRDGDLWSLISSPMRVRFPPPLPTAGSFNGRTAVLQAAYGGSTPSPATTFSRSPSSRVVG
jgi:hypothetical protein